MSPKRKTPATYHSRMTRREDLIWSALFVVITIGPLAHAMGWLS